MTVTTKNVMSRLMYVPVNKPTSYLCLDGMNVSISFSKLEPYTKIHLSLRKNVCLIHPDSISFYKYLVKLYLCPFSTPINEEILRNIN